MSMLIYCCSIKYEFFTPSSVRSPPIILFLPLSFFRSFFLSIFLSFFRFFFLSIFSILISAFLSFFDPSSFRFLLRISFLVLLFVVSIPLLHSITNAKLFPAHLPVVFVICSRVLMYLSWHTNLQ